MITQREDGRMFGSAAVLLSRMVNGESEELVGSRAPFASEIQVEFEGRYVEKPDSFWIERGFLITESPLLEQARQAYWDSKKVPT